MLSPSRALLVLTLALALASLVRALPPPQAEDGPRRFDLVVDSLRTTTPVYQQVGLGSEHAGPAGIYPSRGVLDKRDTEEPHAILIDFFCHLPRMDPRRVAFLCNSARQGFETAGSFLMAMLNLKATIRVNASFSAFGCTATDAVNPKNSAESTSENPDGAKTNCDFVTLGSAAPSGFYTFDRATAARVGADPDFSYPSPLYRQFVAGTPAELSMGQFDITADFNALMRWHFDASPDSIGDKQFDFTQVVLHELIHGLGFITSWYPWLSFDPRFQGLLVPGFVIRNDKGQISGLSKPYIFNKFISDDLNKMWLTDYQRDAYTVINQIRAGSDKDFMDALVESPAMDIFRKVTKSATTDKGLVMWIPPNWDNLILYSPKSYSAGSTLSHVDNDIYRGTSDFLLRPFATSGVRMSSMDASNENWGIIGRVAEVLRVFGWDMKNEVDAERETRKWLKRRQLASPVDDFAMQSIIPYFTIVSPTKDTVLIQNTTVQVKWNAIAGIAVSKVNITAWPMEFGYKSHILEENVPNNGTWSWQVSDAFADTFWALSIVGEGQYDNKTCVVTWWSDEVSGEGFESPI